MGDSSPRSQKHDSGPAKRPPIDWRLQAVELAVVIIGITIAFALNNWYDGVRDNRLARQYQQGIALDLAGDADQIAMILDEMVGQEQAVTRLLTLTRRTAPPEDSVLTHFASLASSTPFNPSRTTYASLRSTGHLALIRDFEARQALVAYYQKVDQYQVLDAVMTRFLQDHLLPFSMSEIDMAAGRFVRPGTMNGYRFRNLVLGYRTLLIQNRDYFRALEKMNTAAREVFSAPR